MTTLTKHPLESRRYKMNFDRSMDNGDKISAVANIAATPSGLVIGESYIDDRYIEFRVSGGVDGQSYDIVAVVETDAGDVMQGDGIIIVSEE